MRSGRRRFVAKPKDEKTAAAKDEKAPKGDASPGQKPGEKSPHDGGKGAGSDPKVTSKPDACGKPQDAKDAKQRGDDKSKTGDKGKDECKSKKPVKSRGERAREKIWVIAAMIAALVLPVVCSLLLVCRSRGWCCFRQYQKIQVEPEPEEPAEPPDEHRSAPVLKAPPSQMRRRACEPHSKTRNCKAKLVG